MAQHSDCAPGTGLADECGWRRPDPGWWAWLGDAHTVAAALAALPVWLVLGMWLGRQMYLIDGWPGVLWFVWLMPAAEELVFRGVLQGQLLRLSCSRRAGPLTWANLWTTAAFVALHLLSQPPSWALAVVLPSLLLGHLRERFNSVLPPVLLHAFYNAGFACTAWWAAR